MARPNPSRLAWGEGQSNWTHRANTTEAPAPFSLALTGSRLWPNVENSSGSIVTNPGAWIEAQPFSPGPIKFGLERPILDRIPELAMVQVAKGATKLHGDWRPGDFMHERSKTTMAAALAADPFGLAPDILLWWQGTSDANDETAANLYGTNIANRYDDLRTTYGDIPIIMMRLHTGHEGEFFETVNGHIEAFVADPANNAYLITMDDISPFDGAHPETLGYIDIGYRYASMIGPMVGLNPHGYATLERGGADAGVLDRGGDLGAALERGGTADGVLGRGGDCAAPLRRGGSTTGTLEKV